MSGMASSPQIEKSRLYLVRTHWLSITNYDVSEMLPPLQGSELACRSLVDAGRCYETPGLETKIYQ